MLGPWAMAHGGWKKRMAWMAYQHRDLRTATAFHATSEQESNEIRALGFRQPIAIVPNGISIPSVLPLRNTKPYRQALFLSRLHPKKGLINLLRAWHAVGINAKDWRLVIAGPDDGGHRSEVAAEIERLSLSDDVTIIGDVQGEGKWQHYVDSDLFVLPSFNENFGIVIAEALSIGLPVITTRQTPWKVIQEQELGWWIETGVDSLTEALGDAFAIDVARLRDKGSRARDVMSTGRSWVAAAEDLRCFYSKLL